MIKYDDDLVARDGKINIKFSSLDGLNKRLAELFSEEFKSFETFSYVVLV